MEAQDIEAALQSRIEKKVNAILKVYVSEMEGRLTALIESKADAADTYVKFKQKVDYTDFEKLLVQVLSFKKQTDNTCKELPETLASIQETCAKQFNDTKAELDNLGKEIEKIKSINSLQGVQLASDLQSELSKVKEISNSHANKILVLEKSESDFQQALADLESNLTTSESQTFHKFKELGEALESSEKAINALSYQITEKGKQVTELFLQSQCQNDTILEIKQSAEIFRKRITSLEIRHDSVNKQLEQVQYNDAAKGTQEADRYKNEFTTLTRDVRNALNQVQEMREKMQAEVYSAQDMLNMEYSRLRTENGFLLGEYERMYSINRDLERSLAKLKEEYRKILDGITRKDCSPAVTREIIDLNHSVLMPAITKRPAESVMKTPHAKDRSKTHSRRISSIAARENERGRNASNIIAETSGNSFDLARNENKFELWRETFTGRTKLLSDKPRGIVLNRFRQLME